MEINNINELYTSSNIDTEMFHYEGGLIIPFDPKWKNIAVNVSGGADSAFLSCTLAKIIQNNNYDCKIHFISFVRVWEFRPWAPFISKEVYDKIKSIFPTIIGDRIESFIPTELEEGVSGPNLFQNKSGDRLLVNSFNKFAIYKFNLNAVYNATTLNPSDHRIGIINSTNKRPRDRELSWYQNEGLNALINLEDKEKNKSLTLYPLRYVDKRFVINGYVSNNWLDVFNITRSCEGDKNSDPDLFASYLGYKHKESKLPLCGHCFWCVEREWALKEVGIENEA
jgi:hypothetical protein